MEHSPLNEAHSLARQAEKYLDHNRFDDAIKCHQRAAEKFQEAMKLTKSPRALESLRLQYESHIRRQNFVRVKKSQCEMDRITLKNLLQKRSRKQEEQKEPGANLPTLIYRSIERADSLIEAIYGKSDDDISEGSEPEFVEKYDTYCYISEKHPKDIHVKIEELLTINEQFRKFVMQLTMQLEDKEAQNAELSERIRKLEDVIKYYMQRTSSENEQNVEDTKSRPSASDVGESDDSVSRQSSATEKPSGTVRRPHTSEMFATSSNTPKMKAGNPGKKDYELPPLELPNLDFLGFETGIKETHTLPPKA